MNTHKHFDKKDKNYRRWWNITDRFGFSMEFSYNSTSYHINLINFSDDEGEWGFSMAIRPIAFYFHVKVPRALCLKESRELCASVHGGGLWWSLWGSPWCDYPKPYGKWRDGNFNFVDFFLGKSTCTRTTLEERDVLIPMPEKSYKATVKMVEFKWTRPRWFAKMVTRADIKVPEGIPHEGKGTCAHNCGVDATYGMTTGKCHSIPKAVGILVGHCLSDRVKYGGWSDWEWRKPREKMTVNKSAAYGMKCVEDKKVGIINPNAETA